MVDDKRLYTLKEETPIKAVLKMGIPVTVGMMFMVAYNLVDTYFVGLMHDDCQLAAVNLSYPIMMILIAAAGVVGNGGASYIARCMGAGENERAKHVLTNGFELIVLLAMVISCVGLMFLNSVIQLLGAKDDTIAPTKAYVMVLLLGAVFTMGNYAVGQLLRSEGSTKYSMVGMIVGNVLNMILDPVFIFMMDMKIVGAAIATVLGNLFGLGICLYFYIRKKTLLVPERKYLQIDGGIIKEIMAVGIPHTLEQLFSTAAIIVNNNLASSYGTVTVAAMGISSKVMSFGNYIYQGIAAGCQPLMGYNYGAKNYGRLKQLIGASILVISVIEFVVMAILGIGASVFVSVFTESKEVIRIGAKTLRVAMCMLPFVGTVSIARNTFNAMGKAMYAFGITVVRQLVLYIPFLMMFNYYWGYNGLICAQPVEEAICMFFSVLLLFGIIGKIEKMKA